MMALKKTIHRPEYKRLIALLQEAREEAGFSQEEVASRLSVQQTWVSKTELGERRLDVCELMDLAKLYKKPLKHFIDPG